jgi:UrcA family protein
MNAPVTVPQILSLRAAPVRLAALSALLAAALLAPLSSAVAGEVAQLDRSVDPVPQVTVNYADLNLAAEAGVRVLHRRIRLAASRVCGLVDARDLRAQAGVHACRSAAVQRAVAEVGNARLAQLAGAPSASG